MIITTTKTSILIICPFLRGLLLTYPISPPPNYSAVPSSPLLTPCTRNGPPVMLQLVSTITQVTTCHRNPEKMDGEINVFCPKKSRKGQKNVFRNQHSAGSGFKSQAIWVLLVCFVRVEFLV